MSFIAFLCDNFKFLPNFSGSRGGGGLSPFPMKLTYDSDKVPKCLVCKKKKMIYYETCTYLIIYNTQVIVSSYSKFLQSCSNWRIIACSGFETSTSGYGSTLSKYLITYGKENILDWSNKTRIYCRYIV